ncbi:transmembrane protease serine 9 [Diplodia corticola]|uniref:Transmembrane protease serine 9 n=1 Tax=Diplodia corticola TaxID=236234 RepID=A0A1J9RXD1_9PEZI|nr:transmembrane protease serine 9 [Diplodia corticola]OJD33007.1 transmembrane protease serine 9 [Diplodia corticola]
MEDVRIPQWTVEKSYTRSQNTSPASTPELDDHDRIRLARSNTMPMPALEPSSSMLQDRYLSSEEDLSPNASDSADQSDDDDDDDDVEIIEVAVITPPAKLAKAVSYVSAGRAKVVDMDDAQPARERTFSVPAVANAVPILKSPVPRMSRMSFANYRPPVTEAQPALPTRSSSFGIPSACSSPAIPARSERRKSSMPARERPSISRSPLSFDPASAPPVPDCGSLRSSVKVVRHYSMAAAPSGGIFNADRPKLLRSTTDLRATLSPSPPSLPTRSQSTEPEPISPLLEKPSIPLDFDLRRPSSARSSYSPSSKRASAIHARQRSGSIQLPPFAPNAASPLTPLTPQTPTFLNTDPFAKKEEDKTEDTSKPAHRRLRSISRTLSLAKIALNPQGRRGSTWGKSKVKTDKVHRDSMDLQSPISPMTQTKESFLSVSSPLAPNMPPTPVTPGMQMPPTPNTAVFSPRTSSRMSNNTVEDEFERPPRTSSLGHRPRLVPRAADEREPAVKLPPFPDADDEMRVPGRRRLTKRKSMLGLA